MLIIGQVRYMGRSDNGWMVIQLFYGWLANHFVSHIPPSVVPPMHIFPGKRFSYNPLEGAVAGAYMGRSDNGWMVTQLFYGWLANHFVSHIPPEHPVLKIVDGHSCNTY